MLHLFWKNTYSLQANNSSKIFSLPLVIVAPNEDYIYDRSDVVHSSIEVFQRSVLQKALYDADAEAEKVCYPLK